MKPVSFSILRLKPDAGIGLSGMSFEELEMRGLIPQLANYDVCFTRMMSNAEIDEIMAGRHIWVLGGGIQVSDILQLDGDAASQFYYRDINGFVHLEFGLEIFQVVLKDDEMMILVVPAVGKPYPSLIKASIDAMQEIVGGTVDVDFIADESAIIVTNKDAQTLNFPINKMVDGKAVKGTFFICGVDGQKNPHSLSTEQFTQFYLQFGFTIM